jgi:hypothetical protein
MNENWIEVDLPVPDFDPDGIVVADVFPSHRSDSGVDPEAVPVISVGLNPVDLAYVYLNVEPPGAAVLARGRSGDLRDAIWLDLRPAEARELAERLRICAEAAARFAEAFPEDVADVPEADDGAVDA